MSTFSVNQSVEIWNHSETQYNGTTGVVKAIQEIRGVIFYEVMLDNGVTISCTDEELLEGIV